MISLLTKGWLSLGTGAYTMVYKDVDIIIDSDCLEVSVFLEDFLVSVELIDEYNIDIVLEE